MSKKIMLFITSLNSGGAERMISLLANSLSEDGYNITIVTTDSAIKEDFYSLNNNVKRIRIEIDSHSGLKGLQSTIKRIFAIRRIIKNNSPDEVISFINLTNIFVLLACTGLKIKPIVSERSDPTDMSPSKVVNYSWLRKKIYKRAKAVVIQTERGVEKFYNICGYTGNNCVVIANPIDKKLLEIPYQYSTESKKITAMGRLENQKGFDLLIKAFSKLPSKHQDWTLTIWGEGSKRKELEAMVKDLNLEERITLPGKTNSAWQELAKSGLFVLSSRAEGIPNVMLESMTIGTPVVATDCDTGPSDLSQNGSDALLAKVEDIDDLSQAILKMIESPELRKEYSKKGLSVRTRFLLKNIIEDWIKLF